MVVSGMGTHVKPVNCHGQIACTGVQSKFEMQRETQGMPENFELKGGRFLWFGNAKFESLLISKDELCAS